MGITYADLTKCAELARKADDLRERYLRLRSAIEGIGVRLDVVRGSMQPDPVGSAAVKLDAIRTQWEERIGAYLEVMLRVDDAIETLQDENQQKVLRARYVEGLHWDDVCKKVHYSLTQCKRFRIAGLKALGLWEQREIS